MKVATRPFTRTRHGFTLSAEQLMEEAARREMGARIRDLRERSPYKQAHMAEQLNVGLRMYQRIEQRGTTEWERVQQIAEIHGVDPHWIWDGEEKPETPDLIAQMNGSSQLDRIEAAIQRLEETQAVFLSHIEAAAASQEVPAVSPDHAQDERRSAPRRSATDRPARAR